jgi:predicted RNase H-like HicB family nuclease
LSSKEPKLDIPCTHPIYWWTLEGVEKNMREAIQFQVKGMRLDGIAVPEPRAPSAYVEVPA